MTSVQRRQSGWGELLDEYDPFGIDEQAADSSLARICGVASALDIVVTERAASASQTQPDRSS